MDGKNLSTSFRVVVDQEPDLAARFYSILFSRYPQVRPLFGHNSPQRQQMMLYQALVAILDHLQDAVWLENVLKNYGAMHFCYGVTAEMYDWFGECLFAAMAELRGLSWTPQLASAWTEAYQAFSGQMKAGAQGRR